MQVAPTRFEQKTPLALEVVEESAAARWLPWLTFANLEPLVRLQETFGAIKSTASKNCRGDDACN